MEIQKVRELLTGVALDHSPDKPDGAIQAIALALLHIAEAVDDLQRRLPPGRSEYF